MSEQQRALLVTGASSGIGAAIAKHYTAKGWVVYGTVRKAKDGDALKAAGCVPVIMDVTNEESVAAAVKVVEAARGEAGLDILVNNAGISSPLAPLEFTTSEHWQSVFETNVLGVVTTTRHFLPLLRKAAARSKPRATRILITGSMAGKLASPFLGPYAASKHAIEAIADSLRVELEPQGIHVALLEPGVIRTEIQAKVGSSTDTHLETVPKDKLAPYLPLLNRVRGWFYAMGQDDIPMSSLLAAVDSAALGSPWARYPVDSKMAALLWIKWALPDWVWQWLAPKLSDAASAKQLAKRAAEEKSK